MSQSTFALLGIMVIAMVTVLGDYFLKVASQGASIRWQPFILGGLIYGVSAFGWVYGMRHLKLATLGVAFSIAMVLCMAALGVFAFGESLSRAEMLGVALAVVSLALLAGHAK